MKDGILVLNKSRQWTSHDCVAVCRRVMRLRGVKKIGHGGTLDPMAEGVLPIFIGQATRIMEYMDLAYKTYECTARLGLRTDTQDIWGQTLEERDYQGLGPEAVAGVLSRLTGCIEQIPPMYSAVRVDGKRLYEYARKGKGPEKEIPPRRVHIAETELLGLDPEEGLIRFRAVCSRGTYIRTLCDDLGRMLGCGCAMTGLTRTAVGQLGLEGSLSPEEVKEALPEDLEERILPPDAPLKAFGKVILSPARAEYFRRGNGTPWKQVFVEKEPLISPDPLTGEIPLNARGRSYDKIYRVYEEGTDSFLGTGFRDESQRRLRADKVLVPKS